jgi:hypothetical protein
MRRVAGNAAGHGQHELLVTVHDHGQCIVIAFNQFRDEFFVVRLQQIFPRQHRLVRKPSVGHDRNGRSCGKGSHDPTTDLASREQQKARLHKKKLLHAMGTIQCVRWNDFSLLPVALLKNRYGMLRVFSHFAFGRVFAAWLRLGRSLGLSAGLASTLSAPYALCPMELSASSSSSSTLPTDISLLFRNGSKCACFGGNTTSARTRAHLNSSGVPPRPDRTVLRTRRNLQDR